MSHIIALDAGHGLKTAGKQTPTGIKEWEITDGVRDKIVNYLNDYDVSFIFPDNNEGNVDESLTSRRAMYVNANATVAVSLHANANKGTWGKHTGVEVYVDKNCTADDLALATLIHNKLVAYMGLKGRGVKKANFTVINQNKVTAVLVEGGFMDSTIDYPVITSDAGKDAYARAVADSLIEFFDLHKKTAPAQPAATPSLKYKVGDKVKLSSYYVSSTDPVTKAIHKSRTGTITKVLTNGCQNPYLIDNGMCWCNDGDIRSLVKSNTAASKPTTKTLAVGSKVKIKLTAKKYCTGQKIPLSAKNKKYTVKQIGTSKYPNGVLLAEIMSWVNKSDLNY